MASDWTIDPYMSTVDPTLLGLSLTVICNPSLFEESKL